VALRTVHLSEATDVGGRRWRWRYLLGQLASGVALPAEVGLRLRILRIAVGITSVRGSGQKQLV